MIFAPEITKPIDLPVTRDDMKRHGRLDFNDDDDLVDFYISAATDYLDGSGGILGRAIMPQTVTQRYDEVSKTMRIPYGPVISVASVDYFDADGSPQTITEFEILKSESGIYLLHISGDLPNLDNDRAAPFSITYQAGYTDYKAVSPSVRQAIKLLAAHWYNSREAAENANFGMTKDIPFGVKAILAPIRKVGV